MSPAEVELLAEGDIVVAVHTIPPLAPHKVKAKWVNEKGTAARLKLVKGKDWVDAAPWQKPPAGKEWSTVRGWYTPTR